MKKNRGMMEGRKEEKKKEEIKNKKRMRESGERAAENVRKKNFG